MNSLEALIVTLVPRILIIYLMMLILFSTPGCSLLSAAKLSDMLPGLSDTMDKLECWLTIEFKKYPDNIDLRNVKVVFSSVVLFEDQSFDWQYIAAKDLIPQGLGKEFKRNDVSQPDQDPPLNVKVKVNYPLRARPRLELNVTKIIDLKAELFWGGKKQDSLSSTIEHVYQRKWDK
jgi:hypothetical protein